MSVVGDFKYTVPGNAISCNVDVRIIRQKYSCPCSYHEGIWEVEILLRSFLTSTLIGGRWLASCPDLFYFQERTAVPVSRRTVESQIRSGFCG